MYINYARSKGVAVVRAVASHQCGPGSNPGVDTICGLSLWLVLSFAPRSFFSGYSGFPLSSKLNIIIFKFHIPIRPGMVNEVPLQGCAISKSLFNCTVSGVI